MNTIPTIGPDAAIAPRTGSGSPQTPPQQRADAAPAVLADAAAKADPGVMLKVVPPALPRDGSVGLRAPAQDPLAGLMAALFGTVERDEQEGVLALPPGVEAEDLPDGMSPQQLQAWLRSLFRNAIDQDNDLLQRLTQSLESLPPETREAIQKASTPAMAQLLKFAAITEAGRREAPARLDGGTQPLAEQAHDAVARLLETIRTALPFQLAARIREFMPAQMGSTLPSAPTTQPSQSALPVPLAQANQMDQRSGLAQTASLGPSATIDEQTGLGQASLGQSGVGQPSSSASPAQAVVNPLLAGVMSAQQAELALRDALRLLMDGRLQWQGVLTPGVPLQLERSDAWQANRGALGGMEKGSSLRLRLQLPNLGDLELRALGFGGQVSVRIHATESSTPAFASALPSLQAKLRDRGLAGAQIALDSL